MWIRVEEKWREKTTKNKWIDVLMGIWYEYLLDILVYGKFCIEI